ncbi:response regulator [Paenibacillus sp. LMG 31456]|uniref:Response regulator n=1 Tax=Paenibacillus foliorum TaxID=2654974 RepID=A0A972GSF2_9BACL|nr:response regulator [Paenibacillus foliorum]NOU95892.1 response regulator [Paenibacillus foliorum]
MKVLIVDDEEHVREGIDLSVDWEAFGVTDKYMAENGMEALEIMTAHQPDILFCDMRMPVMNGTELLRRIREEGLNTQVIVISGYNDFEYTRATIQANGIDYILKPFRKKDVEEAFSKAVSAWQEKVKSKEADVEKEYLVRKADALLDEKKLASYFRNEIPLTETVKRMFDKTGIRQYDFSCLILVPQNMTHVLNKRFMMDDELFLFAIDNIAGYSLSGQAVHYICRLDAYQWVLLLDFPDKGSGQQDLKFYLERLKRAWKHTIQLDVLIGAEGRTSRLTNIHQAIGEAQNALLHLNIGDSKGTEGSEKPLPSLMSHEILLRRAIESGNRLFATDIVQQHAEALRFRGTLLLKDLQRCTMEANLLLGRYSQMITSQAGAMKAPSIPLWVCDVGEWERIFISQIHLLLDKMRPSSVGNGDIHEIRAYLDNHFHENISLKEITEQFHFSPQYISKKFRETFHTTIVAYLTDMKIEKAKALLSHTNLSVHEISNQIGYEDENYFSKVFKKQTGTPPLQYRKETTVK